MKIKYEPLDMRNATGVEGVFTIKIENSANIEFNSNFLSFYQNDDLKHGNLDKIFTKSYLAPTVYYSVVKECSIGPRLKNFPRYWPFFFGENYAWNFLSSDSKSEYKKNGVFDIEDDVITWDKNKYPSLRINGVSVWFYPFGNIDHFYRECLPAIVLLQESGILLSDVKFLCTEISEKMLEFLIFLGVSRSQIIVTGNIWIECEELILPCFGSFGHLHTPTRYYSEVLNFTLKNIVSNGNSGFNKIYVSRRNAKMRRVLNECVIYSGLEKRGFSIVDPGDYSIKDQVDIFSNASLVVGPHGMGIANYGFSKKTAKLMEVMQSDCPRVSYFRTAQLKNCNYAAYWVPPIALDYCGDGALYGDVLLNKNRFFDSLDEFSS